jgi:hypothetical protein
MKVSDDNFFSYVKLASHEDDRWVFVQIQSHWYPIASHIIPSLMLLSLPTMPPAT